MRVAGVRYIGVDLARFLAIAGMMAAHLITIVEWNPFASDSALSAAEITNTLTEGIAAPLFAVLGGLSAVFATGRLLREHRIGSAVAAVAIRGALLVLLGLLLGMIENPIVVVLAYYGTAMLLVAPLVAVRSWVLAVLGIGVGVVGGPLNASLRVALDIADYEGRSVTFDTFGYDWIEAVRALLLTGIYPAITWAVYLLAGILIGRLLVAANRREALGRVSAALAAAGALLAAGAQFVTRLVLDDPAALGLHPVDVVDPELLLSSASGAPLSPDLWAQLIATPHSGSPMDLARTIGIACAVIGVLVLLCDRRRAPGHRPGRLLDIFRAAGAAPLTIYTLHVIATGWLLGPLMEDPALAQSLPWWAAGTGAFLLQLAGALGIGAILSATGRRGPLEALLSGVVRVAVRG